MDTGMRKGIMEVPFGLYIGIWMSMGMAYGTYGMVAIPYAMALKWFLFGIVQYIIMGIVVAAVYGKKSRIRTLRFQGLHRTGKLWVNAEDFVSRSRNCLKAADCFRGKNCPRSSPQLLSAVTRPDPAPSVLEHAPVESSEDWCCGVRQEFGLRKRLHSVDYERVKIGAVRGTTISFSDHG
jgi:hypothetical protein